MNLSQQQLPDNIGPDTLAEHFNVSRESIDSLVRFAEELIRWQPRINLIASGTAHDVWRRHICDGLQLYDHIRATDCNIVDIGSGAGLPAIPLAILLREHSPQARVTLIEANSKKAAFLRHASQICKIHTRIISARLESLQVEELGASVDVVTARALAPLVKLLDLVEKMPVHPQRMLFLKGQDVEAELTQATKCWNISVSRHKS